jgi:hypothetical protein
VDEISFLDSQLTETEKRQGWRLLWDGTSRNGWSGVGSAKFPSQGWTIKNGILTAVPSADGKASGESLMSAQTFHNFDLQLEFKLAKGAESGVEYGVYADANSAMVLEFQLMDDKNNPASQAGVGRNHGLAALYDLIGAENLSVPGRTRQFKGAGEWNQLRIIARHGRVEHWLNNEKAVEYDRTSQIFRALVARSQTGQTKTVNSLTQGHIVLQNQGTDAQFKNIKIREF